VNQNGEVEQRLGTLTSWVTAGLAFILVFTISVMGIMVWQSYRLGENANQLKSVATETHGALCALKFDLNKRYDSNVKILREHPGDPVRVFGLTIPRDQLQSSVDSQKSTLNALVSLDCPT
jgi:hypothetical protein